MSQLSRRKSDNAALDAGDLLVRIGVAILAILVPVSVVLSRRALFSLIPIGAGVLLFGSSLLPHVDLRSRFSLVLRSIPGVSGLALVAWCIVSLLWTPFPLDAAERLWKTGGTFALIAVTIALLPQRTKTSNLYLFPIGLAAAALTTVVALILSPTGIMVIQPEDAAPERAAISLVVLVWPAIGACAIRDRWAAATLLAVAVTIAALTAWTSIALAALAIGALAFTAATWHPARVAKVLAAAAPLLFVAAPLLPFVISGPLDSLTANLGARVPALADVAGSVRVWGEVVRSDPLRTITGHGFDITGPAAASGFLPAPVPKSILFEAWYELGLVGAVAAAVFAAGAFLAVGNASPVIAPFLIAELVAGLTIALWGADTTQLWWVTFLGLAAIAFVQVVNGQYRTERPTAELVRPGSAAQAGANS